MTGVFCHSAITGAEKDQDLVVQALLHEKAAIKNKLMELFERVDDGTGRIGLAEFEMQFENEAVKAVFESLGLGTMDAWTLFQILDSDGNRFIDMDEFVESCIRNRGSAKAVDVCALRHQINKVRRQLSDMAGLQKQMLLQCAAARAAIFFVESIRAVLLQVSPFSSTNIFRILGSRKKCRQSATSWWSNDFS